MAGLWLSRELADNSLRPWALLRLAAPFFQAVGYPLQKGSLAGSDVTLRVAPVSGSEIGVFAGPAHAH